jgi:hypothetical protein
MILTLVERDISVAGWSRRIVNLLEYFFKHHLLSWLEVISVVGDMQGAVYSLRDVRGWFIKVSSNTLLPISLIQHIFPGWLA